jgi:hypothetical protein
VTILDDQWQRRGTFVHAGWIEAVRWLTPERLAVSGFSNARDGGMIAPRHRMADHTDSVIRGRHGRPARHAGYFEQVSPGAYPE